MNQFFVFMFLLEWILRQIPDPVELNAICFWICAGFKAFKLLNSLECSVFNKGEISERGVRFKYT